MMSLLYRILGLYRRPVGVLRKVVNVEKYKTANSFYWHILVKNAETGEMVDLLLTEAAISAGVERANKNTEDLPY